MKDMPEELRRVIETARAALRSKSRLKHTKAIKAIDDVLSPPERQPGPSIDKDEARQHADAVFLVRPEKVTKYDDLLGRRQTGDFRTEDEYRRAVQERSRNSPGGSSA